MKRCGGDRGTREEERDREKKRGGRREREGRELMSRIKKKSKEG